jgi:hypothetical protein
VIILSWITFHGGLAPNGTRFDVSTRARPIKQALSSRRGTPLGEGRMEIYQN